MNDLEMEAAIADRNEMIADELELRHKRRETAVEYTGHLHCNPYKSSPGCVVCDNHDSLHCARGRHCAAASGNSGTNIGEWIGENPDTGHPSHASAYTFEYPTLPGVLFCEDCVVDIDSDEAGTGDPIIEGAVSELNWSVHRADDGGFYGYLTVADRTHGIAWEEELDEVDTLGVAVVFARTEAERRIADAAAAEAMAFVGNAR